MKEDYFKNLMIEPTNICNFHCPICLGGAGFDLRSKGFMAFWQFFKIIDLTKRFLRSIHLWGGFGEPFLNPDIIEMVKYAGENGIISVIHTNGSLLNRKIIDQF